MKKYFLYIEFFLICAFFIVPPLFQTSLNAQNFSINNLQVSFYSFVILLLAIILFLQFEFSNNKKKIYKINLFQFLLKFGKVFLYFGLLILVYSILLSINYFFNFSKDLEIDFSQSSINAKIFFLVELNFLISAFYEENLYRLFFPKIILNFTNNVVKKIERNLLKTKSIKFKFIFYKTSIIIFEIFCNLIFAFSHFYLGIAGVINAFISGAILRFCAKKNHTILIGTFAHFFYNSFIFILAFLI